MRRVRLVSESIDLIARKVLMASFLYYSLDISIVPDEVFDKWCVTIGDRWDELDRHRQWQLGSAKEIRASGFHVKLTRAVIGGALSWLMAENRYPNTPIVYTKPWNHSKRYRVDWLTVDGFAFQEMQALKVKKGRVRLRASSTGQKKAKTRQTKPQQRRVRVRGLFRGV